MKHHEPLHYYTLLLFLLAGMLFTRTVIADESHAQNQQDDIKNILSTSSTLTERAVELQQNITSHQDEIKKLESEIAAYQERLTDVGNQKKTLQTEIKTIDLTRSKLAADVKLTQARIAQTNSKIAELSDDIDINQIRIEKNRELIRDIIRKIDQESSRSFTEVVLSKQSISELLADTEDMNRLQSSIRDSIESLRRLRDELSTQKGSFQTQQKTLLSLNSQLADQKKIADQKRLEQNQLLKDTQNQEANYKKLLTQKQERKTQFEREIDDFEAQLRAEIDPNTIPKPGTKVFAYPVEKPYITQRFGRTVDAVRLYTSGTHNGIDFRAPVGTPIKAAGDGVVIGLGDTDLACRGASYGRWVMIKHKNGLSTMYSHFDLIKVSKGQSVEVGEVIGYGGATGYATGPHLHFAVFVSAVTQIVDLPSKSCPGAIFHIPVSPANGYLDPEAYL